MCNMICAFKAYLKYIHSSINTFYPDFNTRNVIIVFLLYTILVFRKHFFLFSKSIFQHAKLKATKNVQSENIFNYRTQVFWTHKVYSTQRSTIIDYTFIYLLANQLLKTSRRN